MYSQFCYYIQQDEQKRRATMHINRKPGEQIEVDWAGDPAQITDPDTGEIIPAFLFVGVMTYSQYPYVEAFINEKQRSWITAHVHMYEYFGGVTPVSYTHLDVYKRQSKYQWSLERTYSHGKDKLRYALNSSL